MLYTYSPSSPQFKDWFSAANELYLADFLESGGQKQDYLPPFIDPHVQDQFYLYKNQDVELCGSAVLSRLPQDLYLDSRVIPGGTWLLRNTHFHLKRGHPLFQDPFQFDEVVKGFYQSLHTKLIDLVRQDQNTLALTFHDDLDVHEDLKFFGGFQFQTEGILKENQTVCFGLLDLKNQLSSSSQFSLLH